MHPLRTAIRLLILETLQENHLDATWSRTPFPSPRSDDEPLDETDTDEDTDVDEACGNVGLTNLGKRFCEDDLPEHGYNRPCGC